MTFQLKVDVELQYRNKKLLSDKERPFVDQCEAEGRTPTFTAMLVIEQREGAKVEAPAVDRHDKLYTIPPLKEREIEALMKSVGNLLVVGILAPGLTSALLTKLRKAKVVTKKDTL